MYLDMKGVSLLTLAICCLFCVGFVLGMGSTRPPTCAELQAEVADYREFMRTHSCGSMEVEDFLRYHTLKRQAKSACAEQAIAR